VSGDGLQEAFAAAGEVDAVINCAAVSQPGLCEKDEALARWGAA
jgi:dTDP-4-dehydrorhamnose reductase